MSSIRVIECGGSGFRSADVCDGKIHLANTAEILWISSTESLMKFAYERLPAETKAIIFATAGLVEGHKIIRTSPNISILKEVNVDDYRPNPNIPCFVANDMATSITGMALMNPQFPYFMGITWSSGVGARIWKNNEILSDSEVGHMVYDTSSLAPLCGCGKRGCFESYLGGKSITRRIAVECQTRGIEIPKNMHPCKFLDVEFRSGKAWATELYDAILSIMAIFLSNIQLMSRLPAIIWKGTFALSALTELGLVKNLKEKMLRHVIDPQWVDDLEFVTPDPRALSNLDSFLGAAKIAEDLLTA